MNENIVYFTGAGFSAPLGLPVMGNFLFKSKDMYFTNPDQYSHFQDIFSEIQKISVIKNYYAGDLFNIEEVLSILEMRAQLEGSELKEAFIRYLCDVIEYHTPKLIPYRDWNIASNWHAFIFGDPHALYRQVATFVSNLLNLSVVQLERSKDPTERFQVQRRDTDTHRYAIITVNYDNVIEQVLDFINTNFGLLNGCRIEFVKLSDVERNPWDRPALVKLHGSVDSKTVVPPTWSKGVYQEIMAAWRAAHALLRGATQIRIVGYSLPIADAYVKYLFKSAVTESPHLKAIDVICRDSDGSVRKRYEEFVEFRDLRFRATRLEEYMEKLVEPIEKTSRLPRDRMDFVHLEQVHTQFMEDHDETDARN